MIISCNETRNAATGIVAILSTVIVLLHWLFDNNINESIMGGTGDTIGLAAVLAFIVLATFITTHNRKYVICGNAIQFKWMGRNMNKYEINNKSYTSTRVILLDGHRLYYLFPDGKAIKVISRYINRIAQQVDSAEAATND